MAVQSAVVTAIGGAMAVVKPWVSGKDLGDGWLLALFLLFLPLAAGIARNPARLALALVSGLPAGAMAGAVTFVIARVVVSGFWLWFALLAVATAVAGIVFGRLAASGTRTDCRERQ